MQVREGTWKVSLCRWDIHDMSMALGLHCEQGKAEMVSNMEEAQLSSGHGLRA